jgi:hypothetical protein
MAINRDKTHLWKRDVEASVDLFNTWFMEFAPKAFRESRVQVTGSVKRALQLTKDLTAITPDILRRHPGVLQTLRMATCPPLARDRLIGLAYANGNLVKKMEDGSLPPRMKAPELQENLDRISATISRMLDLDIFPWIEKNEEPSEEERYRASTIVADRLCGAISDPIVRNAQERRQLALIAEFLDERGYVEKPCVGGASITAMEPGTYNFRTNVVVDGGGRQHRVNIPIDCVIQPKTPRSGGMPILVEAKSAGDFTNTNKRRKEEATKIRQLKATYGDSTEFILFLCGYFDSGYLGYEAAEGIDWVWEHRIADLEQLGI